MTEFHFVRHGPTEHSIRNVVAGITDSELTLIGHEDTLAAVEKLHTTDPDYDMCLTSGMKRTLAIGACFSRVYGEHLPVFHDSRLKEKNNGVCENAFWPHVQSSGFMRFYDESMSCWSLAVPNGENHSELWNRVSLSLFQWASMFPDKKILVGSHTDSLRIIRGLKRTFNNADLTNALGKIDHTKWPTTADLSVKIPHFTCEVLQLNIANLQQSPTFQSES